MQCALLVQINPDEIEFCRDADGKLWQLGTGGYGHASALPSRAQLLPAVSGACLDLF
jgi:hypothetical protein